MLIRNIEVTFIAPELQQRTIICDYVQFGLEYIGEIVEMFDDSLIENYRGGRERIELKVRLDLTEAQFMAAFLISTEKILVIENYQYKVVNDMRETAFPLFKNSIIGVYPTLRFRKKTKGLTNPAYYLAENNLKLL
jgi:hypothetical protein